jgi:multidrug efflux pump subunit AcrA (membrane-fusion protein)
MAVSDSAISTLAGVSSVYIVKDGKITQQPVTLGVRQGNQWEIVDGLKGNETLAASRLNELATGVSVEMDTGSGEGGGGRKGGGGKSGKGGGRGKREGGSK